jgi:subtilisin family serine protease
VVRQGEPLAAQVAVRAALPAQVRVEWSVDDRPLAERVERVEPGLRLLRSPPLPTDLPGNYLVGVRVDGRPLPGAAYTVSGRPPLPQVREVVALLDPPPDRAADLAARLGLRLVRADELATGVLQAVFEVPLHLTPEQVAARLRLEQGVLAADPNVAHLVSAGSVRTLQYAPRLLNLRAVHAWSTGRGVRVAVVDTGLDLEHPDLAGQVEVAEDFTGTRYRPEVHGTAVASLVAGRGSALEGVAPRARVLSLRACVPLRDGGLDAACPADALVRALDRAFRLGARVVNVSVGGPPTRAVEVVVRRLVALGLLVVAAAGSTDRDSGPYPAAVPGVLAVGATDAADRLYALSPKVPYLALVAPGVDVLAAVPGGRVAFFSGTSFAAAHVSGAAALLLEGAPSARNGTLESSLRSTAKDLGPPGWDPAYGSGRLQPCPAFQRLVGQGTCP